MRTLMNVARQNPGGIRHPKKLFVLINEFDFTSFVVRSRPMAPLQVRAARNHNHKSFFQRKGAQP